MARQCRSRRAPDRGLNASSGRWPEHLSDPPGRGVAKCAILGASLASNDSAPQCTATSGGDVERAADGRTLTPQPADAPSHMRRSSITTRKSRFFKSVSVFFAARITTTPLSFFIQRSSGLDDYYLRYRAHLLFTCTTTVLLYFLSRHVKNVTVA